MIDERKKFEEEWEKTPNVVVKVKEAAWWAWQARAALVDPIQFSDRDVSVLRFVADRLEHVYCENGNIDYIQRLRSIADEMEQPPTIDQQNILSSSKIEKFGNWLHGRLSGTLFAQTHLLAEEILAKAREILMEGKSK